MWSWVLLGGGVVLGGMAWWLHRRFALSGRFDPNGQRLAFVACLEQQIHQMGPEYRVRGFLPDSFAAILEVKGQEVPVPLQNIYHHYQVFPSQLANLVDQLLDEIQELGLENPSDHMLSEVATRILPQICSVDWMRERAPAFGDSALVHRKLAPDLAVCYVIDNVHTLVYLCQAHLRQWGRSEEDIFHLANRNLRVLAGEEVPLPDAASGPVLLRTGDGYDAARVLLLDPDEVQGLLIAMPERDVLWLGREGEESLESLMSLSAEQSRYAAHPLSSSLYRLQEEGLAPVSEADL